MITPKRLNKDPLTYFVHKAHGDLLVLSDNGRLHFPLNLKVVNSPDKALKCQSARTVRR